MNWKNWVPALLVLLTNPLNADLHAMLGNAISKPARSLRQFVEEDLVVPSGQYKGEPFKVSRQPVAGLLFDAIDSGDWLDIFTTGPSQSGKTLSCFVAPLAWHTAELKETYIVALPDMRMAQNKWQVDIEPVFRASPRLRDLLPTSGPGSRGGQIKDTITLTNGAVLKFMTAGGDDTSKAGFTSRCVGVTEAARFSGSSETSVEADPLRQLRARQRSFPREQRRLYVEGTVTVKTEYPYAAREQSSQSRIVSPCPHCKEWISPEREDLVGWQKAKTSEQAEKLAHFRCPKCKKKITTLQRAASLAKAKLLHAGQSIDKRGKVSGDLPPTRRLWFRWSAWHNLLLTAADYGPEEWERSRLEKETPEAENAEKEACQFVWCTPYAAPESELIVFTAEDVLDRRESSPQGLCPEDTLYLAVGRDIGKHEGHCVVIAFRESGLAVVIDYWKFPIRSDLYDPVQAVLLALEEQRTRLDVTGFALAGGGVLYPHKILTDVRHLGEAVYAFIRSASDRSFAGHDERYLPAMGVGVGQHKKRRYRQPTKTGKTVRILGEEYHVSRDPRNRCHVVEANSDYWKSWLHQRLGTPAGQRGAMALFDGSTKTHREFAKHLAAEQMVEEFVKGVGRVERWTNESGKPNHYFDSAYLGCVGGHLAGFRLLQEAGGGQSKEAPQEKWFGR